MDIKYVSNYCLNFETTEMRYYQITALDENSRKRVLEIVEEKSCYNTSKFVLYLEEKIFFKIKTIQTDNGSEYVNNQEKTKEDMKKKVKRYNSRYNNISKKVLDFKSTNEIVKEYFETQLTT